MLEKFRKSQIIVGITVLVIVIIGVVLWLNKPIVMLEPSGISTRDDYYENSVEDDYIHLSVNVEGKTIVCDKTTSGDIASFGWDVSKDVVETPHFMVKLDYKDGVVSGFDITAKEGINWEEVWTQHNVDNNTVGQKLGDNKESTGFIVWTDGLTKEDDDWYSYKSKYDEIYYCVDDSARIIEVKGRSYGK